MEHDVSGDLLDAVAIAIASGADRTRITDSLREQRELYLHCGSSATARVLLHVIAAVECLTAPMLH